MTDVDGRDDRALKGASLLRSELRKRAIREQRLPPDTAFTCDQCTRRDICVSAYDAYNTDGDCLEDK
jgi:hypothetical protein